MKKHVLIAMAILVGIQGFSGNLANASTTSGPVKVAIAKYKAGNYTGCLQYCQDIVAKDPSNAVAYYYMAISYVQAGKKDEAVAAYSKVLALNPNQSLSDYATTGKRCIETPDQCHPEEKDTPSSNFPGGDAFVDAPFADGLSESVRKDFQQKQLDKMKNEINSGEYNGGEVAAPNKGSSIEPSQPVAQKKPTNDEIVAALKVLDEAGLNAYAQSQYNGLNQANSQTPEMAQLSMMLGNNNQTSNNNNNNSMLEMLPLMMAQNKNGTGNYSPQMMQSAIMSSMMPSMDLNIDDDKDK